MKFWQFLKFSTVTIFIIGALYKYLTLTFLRMFVIYLHKKFRTPPCNEKSYCKNIHSGIFASNIRLLLSALPIVLNSTCWVNIYYDCHVQQEVTWRLMKQEDYDMNLPAIFNRLTLILRRSRTGTVWFYTSTSNKRAARPKLYAKSLTRDLKLMYSRFTLVRISIKL